MDDSGPGPRLLVTTGTVRRADVPTATVQQRLAVEADRLRRTAQHRCLGRLEVRIAHVLEKHVGDAIGLQSEQLWSHLFANSVPGAQKGVDDDLHVAANPRKRAPGLRPVA